MLRRRMCVLANRYSSAMEPSTTAGCYRSYVSYYTCVLRHTHTHTYTHRYSSAMAPSTQLAATGHIYVSYYTMHVYVVMHTCTLHRYASAMAAFDNSWLLQV